ncbi:non-ribosomal peptide synthetase family protein [Cylindrospermum sp. FACHB-282]|uniref:non-ribosomal peptide synthetase family protein n=1 Tax=Cylindrospermum sp. FACHB-282 TaxID=2692794 RepID=UPI001687C750|nr:non-ribosomal peptide synthetase [Cylindrospermum sp. FACHB-282]MBD2385758.1 amino acid adenylation domain-containing protein [Cylindrospermum sp. FACHB-282]
MLAETLEGFRLSHQQEHLYLWQQFDQSTAYYAQCAVLITGNVNVEILTSTLEDIVQRHEILRTSFHCLPGMTIPVQVINNHKINFAHIYNFEQLNIQEQTDKIEEVFQELSQISDNFTKKRLLHISLATLSSHKYILFIRMPALCGDSATLKNFVRELGYLYNGSLHSDQLTDEPLQYADFTEWQHELLSSEDAEVGKEYWQQQDLSNILNLEVPFAANKVKENRAFDPQVLRTNISVDFLDKISATAAKYEISTAVFLLTCWQILLWRLNGESKVIVGINYPGRKYDELKDAFGLFAKYLPLQVKLVDKFTFSQILLQVAEAAQEISKWSECFVWEQISSFDENADNLAYCPICFDFEPESANYSQGEVSFEIVKEYVCIDRFKIKLACVVDHDGLNAEFHYDANLLSVEDIQRLAEHFYQLVESAVENPEMRISELEILGDRNFHQLVTEFNQTQADFPQHKCIHQLFAEQVERTPNSIAVTFEQQQLTYSELNTRANQLAHYLQKLGVGSEVLVGICVVRSPEMLVGILAILKAGGAYVPIDPAYPQERIAYILQDAQTSVLLTQQHLLASLPPHSSQTVCIDTAWETIARESNDNPALSVNPENLAYMIYTSGSTGKPKGVQISHRNLVHSTTARIAYYQEPITSFLLLSSFAFDSSVAGIFWTICSGGILHLPQPDLQGEVDKLIKLISQKHISHLLCLPSLYALILEAAKPDELISLSTVIVAGEACSTELVSRHLELQTQASLFNEYGPTEGTVWSSVYHCCFQNEQTQPSIGRPIANTQIYILDSHLHPVPVGVAGELCISGEGLARGYLNQPELTAAKFIPHPFKKSKLARLYKTGDLARYLPNGNIEFLGRIDNQVKIRGFRIELGEIEAALTQHPGVQETVVIVREDIPDNKRLVAYATPNRDAAFTVNELRQFLREKLPEYMIPSAFVLLKELPLSPNGKVDRQNLPAPDQVRPELTGVFVAPSTPTEEMLVKIWSEVLKVERIGIHDNFFDLGGHSLLTTQLLSQVRDKFQLDVSLRSLLENPTVAGLADKIEQNQTFDHQAVDWPAEVVLDSTIQPPKFETFVTEPTSIFLTGATGFLGAFLLAELLQQTKADIYCLVRCPNVEEGKKKLQASLEKYLLWHESLTSRIIPICGNLSEPLLGLEEQKFASLAHQVDVIYHNGAWVHHIYPYSVLKAANVLGTQEVLRLASYIKTKPVHFISASSVFSLSGFSGTKVAHEQDNLDDAPVSSDGYSQTKWVAEKLVKIAGERGLPVCIYRPSRISGHSQTGVFNPNDFLYRLIIGCIQLGSLPDREMKDNIVPVDYVSKAIVYLSKQEKSLNKNFHLVNSQILNSSMLLNQFRMLGYPIEQISYQQWRAELLKVTKGSSAHPLYPLVPFFPAINYQEKTPNSGVLQFDCHNTLDGLADTSIVCPAINNQLLDTYFKYLLKQGFLDSLPSLSEVIGLRDNRILPSF